MVLVVLISTLEKSLVTDELKKTDMNYLSVIKSFCSFPLLKKPQTLCRRRVSAHLSVSGQGCFPAQQGIIRMGSSYGNHVWPVTLTDEDI